MAADPQQPASPPAIDITAAYRTATPFRESPFDSSAINYQSFIKKLTGLLSTLHQGAVIALDAPWGSGKSYFAHNYVELLRRENWTVKYIDAFAADYVEDPFLLLASAIPIGKSTRPQNKNYLRAAAKVGRAILPIAAKAAIKVVTANVVNTEELEKAIAEGAGAAAEKVIQEQIEDFQKERSSFETFRKYLAEIGSSTKKNTERPLVVFIDELDRCRPDFAVKTLERIKHLFDVPEISFVLLLHATQLQHAVKGLYGDIDAQSYLRKFIHFTIPLPRNDREPGQISEVAQYAGFLGSKINLGPAQPKLIRFIKGLQYLGPGIGMSLRDIERALLDFVVREIEPRMYDVLVDCLVNLICLKVMRPDLYEGVRARDKNISKDAISFFQKAVERGCPEFSLLLMDIVISSHVSGKISESHAQNWHDSIGRTMWGGPAPEAIFMLLDKD
jgi:hypothetical protein